MRGGERAQDEPVYGGRLVHLLKAQTREGRSGDHTGDPSIPAISGEAGST